MIQKLLRPSSPGSPAGEAPYQDVAEGIAQEELKGLSYMFWGRLAALALLAVWALTLPFERSAGYLTAIAAFALLGALPYLLAHHGYGHTPALAAFLMLDAVILTYVLVSAVRSRGHEPTAIIEGLRPDRTRTVRGRRQPIAIWCLREIADRLEADT